MEREAILATLIILGLLAATSYVAYEAGKELTISFAKEYVICAAIWINDEQVYTSQPANILRGRVLSGRRHGHCFGLARELYYPDFQNNPIDDNKRIKLLRQTTQGFITSKNRFVDRKEAAEIAYDCGQIQKKKTSGELYSEDIY